MSVILSAQCTDARVNIVTKELFKRYKSVEDFAAADRRELEKLVHSTGFFREKSKSILASARRVRDVYGGKLPDTMEELMTLRGVARKTANVVMHNAHRRSEGIAVDTHVRRVSRLLRLTSKEDPNKIEQDLVKLVPKEKWGEYTHLIIDHGRAVCIARRPKCEVCILNDLCPSSRV